MRIFVSSALLSTVLFAQAAERFLLDDVAKELGHYGLQVELPLSSTSFRKPPKLENPFDEILIHTNGYRYGFTHGRLTSLFPPTDLRSKTQDPDELKVPQSNAILRAKRFARKTGLSDRELGINNDPEITSPRVPGYPFFEFKWFARGSRDLLTSVQVHAASGEVVGAQFAALMGKIYDQDPGQPQIVGDAPVQSKPAAANEQRILSEFAAVLRKASEPLGLKKREVSVLLEGERTWFRINGDQATSNGWALHLKSKDKKVILKRGKLRLFETRRSFFAHDDKPKLGAKRVKLSDSEAILMAAKSLHAFGHESESWIDIKQARITHATNESNETLPRILVEWQRAEDKILTADMKIEIDTNSGEIVWVDIYVREPGDPRMLVH